MNDFGFFILVRLYIFIGERPLPKRDGPRVRGQIRRPAEQGAQRVFAFTKTKKKNFTHGKPGRTPGAKKE